MTAVGNRPYSVCEGSKKQIEACVLSVETEGVSDHTDVHPTARQRGIGFTDAAVLNKHDFVGLDARDNAPVTKRALRRFTRVDDDASLQGSFEYYRDASQLASSDREGDGECLEICRPPQGQAG